MVEGGDWITPTYNGQNRYDKPIFFYWLMAASFKTFGVNEFAARFPSAASGILLCMAVFFFMRHSHDERKAVHAVTSLALSVYFLIYSHAAVTDMALTLFISLSLFSFYLSAEENKRYIYGFYLFSALAFLTKGLIGIVFPFGIAFIYSFVTGGLGGMRKIFDIKGSVLFLIVAAPWYVAQTIVNGQEFIQQFFIKHHFQRYTGVISGHKGPIFYYIPFLLLGLFPWAAFLPSGIREVFKGKDRLNLFAFIWIAFILLFFSFSTTKLPNYILSALPAASLLISSGMSVQDRKWRYFSYGLMALLSVLLGIAAIVSKEYLIKSGIHNTGWIFIVALIMLLMAILSVYAVFMKKESFGFLSTLTVILLLVLSTETLPAANRYLQGTLHRFSLYAKERLQDNERIITYRINNPSIVFYSGHKAAIIRNKGEMESYIKENSGHLAITKISDMKVLKDLGYNVLEEDGTYALLERE